MQPLQLMCRALRLTPACYSYFELSAANPHAPVHIEARVSLSGWYSGPNSVEGAVSFDSIAELATAMSQFAVMEGLRMRMLPGARGIVLQRANAAMPATVPGVQ